MRAAAGGPCAAKAGLRAVCHHRRSRHDHPAASPHPGRHPSPPHTRPSRPGMASLAAERRAGQRLAAPGPGPGTRPRPGASHGLCAGAGQPGDHAGAIDDRQFFGHQAGRCAGLCCGAICGCVAGGLVRGLAVLCAAPRVAPVSDRAVVHRCAAAPLVRCGRPVVRVCRSRAGVRRRCWLCCGCPR